MFTRRIRAPFGLLAAILIALASVVSAGHMAPDRDDIARAEIQMVYGGSADDYCQSDHDHSDHRCPFCRLLPEEGHAPLELTARAACFDLGVSLPGPFDLPRQRPDRATSPRAPPRFS